MTTSNDDPAFAKLVQKFAPHSILRRSWALTGGVSAQVIALEIETPDGLLEKWVVRQHGETDLKRHPVCAPHLYAEVRERSEYEISHPL